MTGQETRSSNERKYQYENGTEGWSDPYAQHGVKPRKTMENIEKAVEKGQVENLIVGGAKVGKNKWKITQMTEAWDIVMNCGEVQKATLNLTLEEYL